MLAAVLCAFAKQETLHISAITRANLQSLLDISGDVLRSSRRSASRGLGLGLRLVLSTFLGHYDWTGGSVSWWSVVRTHGLGGDQGGCQVATYGGGVCVWCVVSRGEVDGRKGSEVRKGKRENMKQKS